MPFMLPVSGVLREQYIKRVLKVKETVIHIRSQDLACSNIGDNCRMIHSWLWNAG